MGGCCLKWVGAACANTQFCLRRWSAGPLLALWGVAGPARTECRESAGRDGRCLADTAAYALCCRAQSCSRLRRSTTWRSPLPAACQWLGHGTLPWPGLIPACFQSYPALIPALPPLPAAAAKYRGEESLEGVAEPPLAAAAAAAAAAPQQQKRQQKKKAPPQAADQRQKKRQKK